MQQRQPEESLWIIVPAAGRGSRMDADLPKQYLPLLDHTVIEITLEKLLSLDNVEKIIVSLHAEDRHWQTLSCSQDPRIQTVIGGEERSLSVLAALKHIRKQAQKKDWVLIHDAARACIMTETVESMLETLGGEEIGGILAVASDDTLKQVADQRISSTLDRHTIWRAQTPQVFRYDLLYRCLLRAVSDSVSITDDASAVEIGGYMPKVLPGRKDNIKITHPEDLRIAEFILRQQQSNRL